MAGSLIRKLWNFEEPRAQSGHFHTRRAFTFTLSANKLRPVKRSPRFHNFRINDPASLIQSSYFITDFKESKSMKKKFRKGPNL